MQKVRFLGLPLTLVGASQEVVSRMEEARSKAEPLLVTFINPHAWTMARRDRSFPSLLEKMSLVLPDGIAVARMASLLLGRPVERMSFDASSLYDPIFRSLEKEGCRLFVIGAAPGIAAEAVARMQAAYPGIAFVGCLDGFQPQESAVQAVIDATPDMVLCGMGAPHQERFLLALRDVGFKGAAFTCGGFLDQLALAETYYPAWIDRLELRWAYRVWKEPRRLWRRYAVEYLPFIRLSLARLLQSRLMGKDWAITRQA